MLPRTDVAREHRRDLARLRQALAGWMEELEPRPTSERLRRGEEYEERLKALGYLQ